MLCSRYTIPNCVVCSEPTMEAGADDRPYAKAYNEDGWTCSQRCEWKDILATASPTDWRPILDAALDLGDLDVVRIHRPGCTPVEGVVCQHSRAVDSYTIEDANGDEVDVLAGMIERVEVVE